MIYLLTLLGFALLIKGADWLVDGSIAVASRLGVSHLIIGLTIVSMGTSMPELIIGVIASVEGRSGLAIGNVLGSNIANVLLILGVTAVVCDLPVRRNTILSEVPFSLAAALLVGFLANSSLWYEQEKGLHISRGDGVIILFFFILFMAYVLTIAREDKKSRETDAAVPATDMRKDILLILAGAGGLFLGGSNIFNLLWILGINALICPLPFDVASNMDLLVVIASSCLILLALMIGRRMTIKKVEGIVFLLAYAAYLYFVVERG
jgi:cation:H+ antiporter